MMPRLPRPRLEKARGRWFANIGDFDHTGRRREVYAPRSVQARDEAGAWAWFLAECQAREIDTSPPPKPKPNPPPPARPKRVWLFDRADRLHALADRAEKRADAIRSTAGRRRRGYYILAARAAKLRQAALAESLARRALAWA